jgi:ribosomal protein S18 acetylase RimI-like enzyme
MSRIEILTAEQAKRWSEPLAWLLQDAVAGGASVGFLPPVRDSEARAYWEGIVTDVAVKKAILFAAFDNEKLVGSVQLHLPAMPNARHRASVEKLMVLREHRRQGIGRALMEELEGHARELGRTILVLDTRKGDVAEQVYEALGYRRAGKIPRYARGHNGALEDTVIYYRELADGEDA